MNFIEKFNEIANKTLVPIANKLGNQRHLAAIRDGMVVAIPLSILGGFCLIISTPPFTPKSLPDWGVISDLLIGWYNWAQANATALRLPYNMTMALMGLFVAIAIAYHLAKRYEMSGLNAAIVSTTVFLLICAPTTTAVLTSAISEGANTNDLLAQAASFIPTTYLDAKGIFTAIIVSIGCVEIMRVMLKKNIRFKMPEGVPPAIASSFDSILPLFVCMGVFYGLSLIIQNISGELLPSLIMTILAPAISGLDSLLVICLITIIAQTFWFFGLHGASITQPIRLPFMQMYLMANITAFSAGEPIIFGLPMVLNPLMMIPFIFVPVINTIIAYTCMALNIVGKGVVETPWTTPAPIGAALGCMDIKAGIMVIILIILDMLLYYPFFKLMEKQKLAEENS